MKVGFIGTGNMGGAIIKGYLKANEGGHDNILAVSKSKDKLEAFTDSLGIKSRDSIGQLVADSDIIVIAVKPNIFEEVLPEISDFYNGNKILVSIAAGISISFIESYMKKKPVKIARAMPNTPAMVNEGMTALCKNSNITEEEFQDVIKIFASVGKVQVVEEDLIDVVIGVSGSSPAYTYMFIEALIDSAVKNGMDKEQARIFAAQAVLGSAKMVLETGIDPVTLRENVCSKGGTTIEAVNVLLNNGFADDVSEAFNAAVRNSKLLTK